MEIHTLIQGINSSLQHAFHDYMGVYFFGSRLRGENREFSDYDMMFVFRTQPDWRKKDRIRTIVYQKELEYEIVIDGKYYAQHDVENCQTPFLETVYNEGAFYGIRQAATDRLSDATC